MKIAVQIEPLNRTPADVDYRWDADTDILTANLKSGAVGEGLNGSVELTGSDGSWLILDVAAGAINGVEVAVWPDVRKLRSLVPPPEAESVRVIVSPRKPRSGVASIEVDTSLLAESDQSERTIHFRVGVHKPHRTVRIARDILVDLDDAGTLAGLWLLNVPPFPADA